MLLPKPLKKFVAIFRGEVAPVLILLSVALGFWFGLTPGWYGIHVVLLFAALVLSIHFGIFLMSAGIAKSLSFVAAPVLYHAGLWMHHHARDWLDALSRIPIVGITDFSRYAVAGALLLGPAVGLLLGLCLAGAVTNFRRKMLQLEEGSETLRRWREKRLVKFLDWLLLGKKAKDVKAVLQRRTKLIRWPGVAVALLLLTVSAVALHLSHNAALEGYAADSLTQANGAQVDLDKLDLSALQGRITCVGLAVTDPDKPTHDRVAIATMTADVSLWQLLLGRLVMDSVELTNVRFDQPRKSPGKLSATHKTTTASSTPLKTLFDSQTPDADTAVTYFRDAEQFNNWFRTLQDWLPEKSETARDSAPQVPQSILQYLSARAAASPTPRLIIRKLVLENVSVPVDQIGNSRITCTNLSDLPGVGGDPLTIEVDSSQTQSTVRIQYVDAAPQPVATIEATLKDIDLRQLQGRMLKNNPVVFTGGTVTAQISGRITHAFIDLAIASETNGMQARCTEGGVLGLDSGATAEALKVMSQIKTTLRLVGPLAEPRLVFDTQALAREMKTALVNAGKAQVATRLDELAGDKLPVKIPKTDTIVNNPQDAVGDVVSGLFGDETDKKADEER